MNRKCLMMFVFILMINLLGCNTTAKVMKSWVGHSESQLVANWGAPDKTVNLPDGSKVYTWKSTVMNGLTDKSGTHEERKTFTIGSDGIVKSWSYEGGGIWW